MAENRQLTDTKGTNHVWRNVGAYPLVSFSFMLRVEGLWDLPCKRITGIRRENEFDYIQEGGLNDYVHAKRKAISKPFTFQVERYVGVDLQIAADPLSLGTELVLPLILFVNKYAAWAAKDMKPVRTYAFTGCTVIGKDYGELNAEQSGLLLETTTISYREMACVDIYADMQGMTLKTWSFDEKDRSQTGSKYTGKYNKEGKGPRRYNQATSNTTELTKSEMSERASLWPQKSSAQKPKTPEKKPGDANANKPASGKWGFDPKDRSQTGSGYTGVYNKEGKGPRNYNQAATNTKEPTRAEMNERAKLWPPTKSAQEQKAKGKDPKARLWPGEKSAQKRGTQGKKPTVRLWPKMKSAQVRKVVGKDQTPRLWPEEESAQKHQAQGIAPAPRLWPRVKSAQSITQYLADYKNPFA